MDQVRATTCSNGRVRRFFPRACALRSDQLAPLEELELAVVGDLVEGVASEANVADALSYVTADALVNGTTADLWLSRAASRLREGSASSVIAALVVAKKSDLVRVAQRELSTRECFTSNDVSSAIDGLVAHAVLVDEAQRASSTPSSYRDFTKALLAAHLDLLRVDGEIAAACGQGSVERPRLAPILVALDTYVREGAFDLEGVMASSALAGLSNQEQAFVAALLRLAVAPPKDVVKVARESVITLPPWADHVVFELDGTMPRLSSSAVVLNASGAIGYQDGRWGGVGRGAYRNFEFSRGAQTRNELVEGSVEGFRASVVGATTEIELRLAGGGSHLNSSIVNAGTGPLAAFNRESTNAGYGSIFGSLRYEPASAFAAALGLGVGLQYERYTGVSGNSFALGYSATNLVTARGETRVVVRWLPVTWLALRAEGRASVFGTQLGALETLFFRGQVASESTSSTNLSVMAHAFEHFDLEAARVPFVELVPSVDVGFDAYVLDAAVRQTAFVPAVGLGLRRETL